MMPPQYKYRAWAPESGSAPVNWNVEAKSPRLAAEIFVECSDTVKVSDGDEVEVHVLDEHDVAHRFFVEVEITWHYTTAPIDEDDDAPLSKWRGICPPIGAQLSDDKCFHCDGTGREPPEIVREHIVIEYSKGEHVEAVRRAVDLVSEGKIVTLRRDGVDHAILS